MLLTKGKFKKYEFWGKNKNTRAVKNSPSSKPPLVVGDELLISDMHVETDMAQFRGKVAINLGSPVGGNCLSYLQTTC